MYSDPIEYGWMRYKRLALALLIAQRLKDEELEDRVTEHLELLTGYYHGGGYPRISIDLMNEHAANICHIYARGA